MIVDAPSNLFSEKKFFVFLIIALVILFASIPGWEKKFLSSADKNELITIFGIESYGTNILFSEEKSLTSSPPPEYNFAQIPTVHGIDTFWIQKRDGVPTVPVAGGSGEEEHSIHLPQPSYWPFLVSLGLFIAAYGLIYFQSVAGLAAASIGTMLTMVSVYAWSFEPVNDPEEEH